MKRNDLRILAVTLVICLLTIQAFAANTGDIQGTVVDPSGAVVQGAKITITNKDQGFVKEITSDQHGEFAALQLSTGDYNVRIEKPGLRTVEQVVIVRSAEKTRLDLKMQLGKAEEMVSVDTVAPTLDVASAQISRSVDSKTALALPNQGRNALAFATLSAGVVPVTNDNPFLGTGSFNSNGSRGRGNNITLDNVTSTDISTTGGSELGTFSLDAIQEFKLITNNFDAEYGRNSGSQVQIITKSGSNSIHGDAYYFLQNRNFNARSYFDTTGSPSPLVQNVGGFTVGGPVFKNHTFFFGHWEINHTRGSGATRTATVLTPAQAAGITDPTSLALFTNDLVPTSASGSVSNAAPNKQDAHSYSIRIDQVLRGGKDNFYVRYGDNPTISTSASLTFVGSNLPNYGAQNTNHSRQLTFNYSSTLSPTLVNQFRFSFGRSKPGFQPLTTITGALGPQVNISGFDSFGESNIIPQGRLQNTFQYGDTVSWSKGRHSFKFGGDAYRYQAYSVFDSNLRGTVNFGGLAAFQAGTPTSFTQNFGNTNRHNFALDEFFFVQDDFRLTDTLTLNLGYRLESSGGVSEGSQILANLNPNNNAPLGGGGTGPLGGIDLGGSSFNRNYNSAPRVGLAWNPNHGKFVVRGGYGIAYDYIFLNPITNLRFAAPFVPSIAVQSFTGGNTYAALIAGTAPQQTSTIAGIGQFSPSQFNFGNLSPVDQHLKNPRNQQFSFGLEYEALRDLVLKATYVGTLNDRLQASIPINLVKTPVAGATSDADEAARLAALRGVFLAESGNTTGTLVNNRLDTRFNSVTQVQSVGHSNYHALQFEAVQRFSHGLTFDANYTYAHSIDDVSDVLGVLVNDSANLQNPSLPITANRGNSQFDIRQRFSLSYSYELPFTKGFTGLKGRILDGWVFSGVFEQRSGLPTTIFAGSRRGVSDIFLDGNSVIRANGDVSQFQPSLTPFSGTLCSRGVNSSTSAATICPNVANFPLTQPLLGNVGNSGRNKLYLDGLQNLDMAISKNNKITERASLLIRWEVFNVLNHANFSQFVNVLTNPNFGTYQGTATNMRQMQASAKFVF